MVKRKRRKNTGRGGDVEKVKRKKEEMKKRISVWC